MKTLLSLLVLLGSASSFANDERLAITSVVQKYFDGTSKGRPELVTQAFAPSLELQYVNKKGQLGRWPGTEYIARIKPGKTNGRIGKIISIDITGDAAVVKATVSTAKSLFTDYLLLLKIDTGWQITNKIFTREPLIR